MVAKNHRPTIISLLSHHYPSIITVKSCKITLYINSHLDAACSHHNPTRQQLSFPGTSEWQLPAFGGDISTIVSTQIDMIFTLWNGFFDCQNPSVPVLECFIDLDILEVIWPKIWSLKPSACFGPWSVLRPEQKSMGPMGFNLFLATKMSRLSDIWGFWDRPRLSKIGL